MHAIATLWTRLGAGKRWAVVVCVVALIGGAGAVGLGIAMRMSPDLARIEQTVAVRWPAVAQLPRGDLAGLLANAAHEVVLIDVREADEHAVSHLPGAIRVDPGIDGAAFLAAYGAALNGKTAVFYCSVGVRSSILAARIKASIVQDAVGPVDTFAVYNLTGGIFGWHNEARPLTSAQGPTEQVHGYDARWGKLVRKPGRMPTAPSSLPVGTGP